MVNVLVTGGAGFIGSNFVRYALTTHADWRVTTLDKLTYAGRRENLHDVMDHPRHAFVHGDIGDAAVSGPLVEQSELVHYLEGRGMNGIAGKVAQEIAVLFQHQDFDAAARQ